MQALEEQQRQLQTSVDEEKSHFDEMDDLMAGLMGGQTADTQPKPAPVAAAAPAAHP